MEDYSRLMEASEKGDGEAAEKASRQLEMTIRLSAKNLSEKYLAPPFTTDFGILFLSTEGLYAEAMRRPSFADAIQREYRVVLSGPSTLAALLNALQMGFRTLAIQKRSSEVWETLGSVKTEFSKYAQVLVIVKKKLSQAQDSIDKAETRTRAIQRTLRDVEAADALELPGDTETEDGEADRVPILASAMQARIEDWQRLPAADACRPYSISTSSFISTSAFPHPTTFETRRQLASSGDQ